MPRPHEEHRLWAPWRLDYIKSPKPESCIFCDAAQPDPATDEQRYIVHRGERCYVMLNAFPYNNGHVMVSPYAHVPSIEELDEAAVTELMALTQRSLRALRAVYSPDGFNIGINQGKVAGAGFDDHLHQHVVPRWGGDTNFMPVIGHARVLPESLADSFAALRAAFART